MLRFQPSFSFWPRPRFLGGATEGLAAWIARRNASPGNTIDEQPAHSIKEIIDQHHDRHGRTIDPARRHDV